MSPSTPLLRPTTLAALVASALLGACGGGAGNAGSAFESAQFADASLVPPPTSDEAPPIGGESAPEPVEVQREQAASTSCTAPT